MKALFCDVDGVLNNSETRGHSPGGYTGVSDALIRNLKKIIDETGARIVLSSDWRLSKNDPVHGKDYRYLERKLLYTARLKISGQTDDISWSRRGKEIRQYLDEHPEITAYVILDDNPFSDFKKYNLQDHLVLTDWKEGLTEKDVERAVSILQQEIPERK